MGTGPKRQAETPKGGHACPFCQVGFLTESRSSNLLYCSGCGQVMVPSLANFSTRREISRLTSDWTPDRTQLLSWAS